MTKKTSLSKGKKLLLFFISASVLIAATITLWLQESNVTPVVNIPAPVMPIPNARDIYLKALKVFIPYRISTSTGIYSLTFSNMEMQIGDAGFGKGPGIAATHGAAYNGDASQPSLAELRELVRVNAVEYAGSTAGYFPPCELAARYGALIQSGEPTVLHHGDDVYHQQEPDP